MSDMHIDLTGEVALVSGASRGIGKAIAIALAKAGCTVIGTATSESGAEAITAYFKELGVSGHGSVLDVTDGEAVTGLLVSIKENYSPVSILVNNAGIAQDNLLVRMSEAQWEEVIDTNLNSVFRMTKACLKDMMKARKGRVINITSVIGATGNSGQGNYAASKAGVVGFTRSIAQEVGVRGITVNAVAPGFIKTDMTAGISENQEQNVLSQQVIQRLGEPEDIAQAVCFLASSWASYITGETLHVNGGRYMA